MQNLRNPRQWEDGRKKSRKEEKGIDKRGRIWYSNKAVGAAAALVCIMFIFSATVSALPLDIGFSTTN